MSFSCLFANPEIVEVVEIVQFLDPEHSKMEFLDTDTAKILDPKFVRMDQQISGHRMGRFLDSKFINKINSVQVSKLWTVLGNRNIINLDMLISHINRFF